MTEGSRVLMAIRVKSTPARAFDAFTKEISLWWRPNGLFQFTRKRNGVLSFESGGAPASGSKRRLVETYEDGTVYVIGEVRVWDPPRRLVVSWRQDSFATNESTELHVRFDEAGDHTRVTVEHFGWDTIPPRHAARHGFPLATFQLRFAEWWQVLLRGLRDHVHAGLVKVTGAVAAAAPGASGDTLAIRDYSDELAKDFYAINAEWIESMFTLEEKDREVLTKPRETIIDRGGFILFVESAELGVVGTCALMKTEEGVFELTKMGVLERARGRKAGEVLLEKALARANAMDIDTLYLLTNAKCVAAIKLYEKVGFQHDADIMTKYGAAYARANVAMRYRR